MNANIRIFINIKSASGEIDHLLESPMRWARAEVVRRRGGLGRAGLGRNARGRGAGRVGDAGRWFVSGVRCGFGGAAGWGVTRGFGGAAGWGVRGWGVTRADVVRGGQGRDEGLELVWRHRGDGYFLQFTWHPNRPYRALQGTSARAMTSICVHRAPRTPPDSAPGHIRSRDDFQEDYRRSATGHTRPSETG